MGNKASRLLAFQLRTAQSGHAVPKIRHPESNFVETQPKEISEAFAIHYKQLYKGQECELKKDIMNAFLGPLNMKKLTTDEATNMIRPITEDELRETIAKLKNNSSSGVDGFSGQYYCLYHLTHSYIM